MRIDVGREMIKKSDYTVIFIIISNKNNREMEKGTIQK